LLGQRQTQQMLLLLLLLLLIRPHLPAWHLPSALGQLPVWTTWTSWADCSASHWPVLPAWQQQQVTQPPRVTLLLLLLLAATVQLDTGRQGVCRAGF
jgi:hypothetical protein